MTRNRYVLLVFVFVFALTSCSTGIEEDRMQENDASGKLFIIGGGKRPAEMINRLVDEASIRDSGYIVVLPMSSSEPDTSAYYAKKQFIELGINRVVSFNFDTVIHKPWVDSLRAAQLIYISGGDQSRFMKVVMDTPIQEAIHAAYRNGATIAGTSAGAAVMSKKMITGTEFKHPEYTGNFRTIEANNMELVEGLGLLENAIIDQHFIWRMRMNRLLTVAIENPEATCIGIDESTAILVKDNIAEVVGNYQVITIRNPNDSIRTQNGLLGAEELTVGIHLPGDTFKIIE